MGEKYNIREDFNILNDYFIRYLFTSKGNEHILLDFINAVMSDYDLKTFQSVEILNPFNLKNSSYSKESIVDVKCTTDDGIVVIIEIQVVGNAKFSERILYYWAKNYSLLLKDGENYSNLKPVISINILNFNIDLKHNNVHSCYMIYEDKSRRLLTDHLQLHFIELKKYKEKIVNNNFVYWLEVLIEESMKVKEYKMKSLVKEKPLMADILEKIKNFQNDDFLMSEYDKREAFLYGQQIMLEEERRQGRIEGKLEGIEEGRKEGRKEGIEEGRKEGRKEGIEKGRKEGLEKGIEQGLKEGLEEGRKKEKLELAKGMKKDNMPTDKISKYTGLSVEDIEKL